MRAERHFDNYLIALVSAVLATLLLIACRQSQPSTSGARAPEAKTAAVLTAASMSPGAMSSGAMSSGGTPAGGTTAAATAAGATDVYVVFEGPWAMASDPKDAKSVLFLAPKTTHHRDLYVLASNRTELGAGTYDLTLPSGTAPGAGVYDRRYYHAKIDPLNVQRVLDSKSGRYAIRLPKPDAYVPATVLNVRVDTSYPPPATSAHEYATGASLRYHVSTLNGFSLSGTPDTGSFGGVALQVDTPVIRFAVEPNEGDDACHLHSRRAFHDLTQMVGLKLYLDFEDTTPYCRKTDPQNPHPVTAALNQTSPLGRVAALLARNLADSEDASAASSAIAPTFATLYIRGPVRSLGKHLLAALYFFGGTPGDCKGIIIGDD